MTQRGWHINLDNCIACRACEGACKQEFNLPVGVRRRLVVVQEGEVNGAPVRRHITSACMHCENPPCMTVCPVGRYYKDVDGAVTERTNYGMTANPTTGLVLIKPSRAQDPVNGVDCIACKRCMAVCPYGAISFDPVHNVADKCTGCYHRLFDGDLPASRRRAACELTCTSYALKQVEDITALPGTLSRDTGAPPGFREIAPPTGPNSTNPSVRYTLPR